MQYTVYVIRARLHYRYVTKLCMIVDHLCQLLSGLLTYLSHIVQLGPRLLLFLYWSKNSVGERVKGLYFTVYRQQ